MAQIKMFKFDTDGFPVENDPTADDFTINSLTMDAGGGGITMAGEKITGLGDASADGDAIGYQQTGAELGDLTITSGGDIDVAGGGELTGLPAVPTGATAAASKAYVDSLVSGLGWKEGVVTLNMLGTNDVATINALSGTLGDSYVMSDAGDLTEGAGADPTVAAGDIVEFDGTDWIILITNSGGFPPIGTRVILSGTGTLIAPHTDATDNDEIHEFGGASLTPTDTGDAVDSAAVLIQDPGHIGVYDNEGYTYEGTSPSGAWIQFTGTGNINAGDGLTKTANTLDVVGGDGIVANANDVAVDLATNPGLQFTSNKLDLLLKSANELAKDASGLYVVGVPDLFKIGATATGATVTAANLDTLTDVSNADSLHTHSAVGSHTIASHSDTSGTGAELNTLTDGSDAAGLHIHSASDLSMAHTDLSGVTSDQHHAESHTIASHSDTAATGAELTELTDGSTTSLHVHAGTAEAERIETGYTTDGTGVTAGDPVYISANGIVSKCLANNNNTRKYIGIAKTTVGASAAVEVVSAGKQSSVAITTPVAGALVYLAVAGGLTTVIPPATSGNHRMVIGKCANTVGQELHIEPQYLGKVN